MYSDITHNNAQNTGTTERFILPNVFSFELCFDDVGDKSASVSYNQCSASFQITTN